jgi:hypothetical protein
MADLFSVAQTYGNDGNAVAASNLGANYATRTPGNGIAGRTVVVSVIGAGGNVSQTELNNVVRRITMQSAPGAGVAAADAFVVIGVAGTIGTGTMHLALQGTGTVGTDANDYATGVTVAVVADFPGLSG